MVEWFNGWIVEWENRYSLRGVIANDPAILRAGEWSNPLLINKHIDHLNPFFNFPFGKTFFCGGISFSHIWKYGLLSLHRSAMDLLILLCFPRPDRDGLLLAHRFICGNWCPHPNMPVPNGTVWIMASEAIPFTKDVIAISDSWAEAISSKAATDVRYAKLLL